MRRRPSWGDALMVAGLGLVVTGALMLWGVWAIALMAGLLLLVAGWAIG